LIATALADKIDNTQRVRTAKELEAMERNNIISALETSGWKVAGDSGAANLLGMKPSTLSSRMKALGIERQRQS
jgi:transcriptional regulator with GAF, ATPase, and Fis domain